MKIRNSICSALVTLYAGLVIAKKCDDPSAHDQFKWVGERTILDFSHLEILDNVYAQCRNPKHAVLTFDDGPHSEWTPRLLDVLKKNDIRAAFFVIGESIPGNEAILKRMREEGHTIASHTYSHPALDQLSQAAIKEQMDRTSELIDRAAGVRPRLMRAPEGRLNKYVLGELKAMGYSVIHWNNDAQDWIYKNWNDPNLMTKSFDEHLPVANANSTSGGPIILQHDHHEKVVGSQQKIIDIVRKKGYQFVTLKECIGIGPYHGGVDDDRRRTKSAAPSILSSSICGEIIVVLVAILLFI